MSLVPHNAIAKELEIAKQALSNMKVVCFGLVVAVCYVGKKLYDTKVISHI